MEEYFKKTWDSVSPSLAKLLEEVWMEGYKQGQLDNRPKVKINEVVYMDLGLPSGTLWSTAPQSFFYGWHLDLFTYEQAKSLGIPTKEQWEELLQYCYLENEPYPYKGHDYCLPKLTGPNGERLGYPMCKNDAVKYLTYTLGQGCERDRNKFWLLSEEDENHFVDVLVFDRNVMEYDKHFKGYKLPCFLVKNKFE